MSAIYVHMFASLKLMAKMEMGNFMGNRKTLSCVSVIVSNRYT
jgi:hypothetical protein